MPEQLKILPFHAGLLHIVKDFDCGSHPCQIDVANWIKAPQDAEKGAVPEMAADKRLAVWLYFNHNNDLVGYGSLGETKWEYPDASSQRVKLCIIPYMGVDKKHWGQRGGPAPSFGKQILRHLIAEARERAARRKLDPPLLGLYVHPANKPALRLYNAEGFSDFHKRYLEGAIEYLGKIIQLAEPND